MSEEDNDEISVDVILDWINQAGLQHNELPNGRLPQNIHFVSNVGVRTIVSVFVDQRMLNRLNFQFQININEQHQQILENMQPQDFNRRMNDLSSKMTSYGINWNWQLVPNTRQRFSTLRITKFIDSTGLSRDNFYQTLTTMEIVGNQILRELQVMFGDIQNLTETQQQNPDENPTFIG